MKQDIEEMLRRHPEGLTAFQLAALTYQSESTIYKRLHTLQRSGIIDTTQAWDLPRKPTIYRLKKNESSRR